MLRTHAWIAIFALVACQTPHEQTKVSAPEAHEPAVAARPATSLASAIETAQKSVPDGRFLKAAIEDEDGKQICSVFLASGDGQREVRVDVTSGAILATENEALEPESTELLAALGKDPAPMNIGAAKAIEAAQAKVPVAWAFAVSLELPPNGLTYVVVLLDGSKPKVAQVSAADGTVRKVSALEEEDDASALDLTEPPTISLASGIELARKKAPTAAFIHAELGIENERANCLVCFIDEQKLRVLELDAEDGDLLVDGSQKADADDLTRWKKGLEHPRTSIDPAQAISGAIKAVPGSWARMIDLDCEAEPLAYVVEVVQGKLVKEVHINAIDGALLSVRDPEETSDEPGY